MASPAAPPAGRVRGLVKRYGERAVLDGVELEVAVLRDELHHGLFRTDTGLAGSEAGDARPPRPLPRCTSSTTR